jgi:hypothetical protein
MTDVFKKDNFDIQKCVENDNLDYFKKYYKDDINYLTPNKKYNLLHIAIFYSSFKLINYLIQNNLSIYYERKGILCPLFFLNKLKNYFILDKLLLVRNICLNLFIY